MLQKFRGNQERQYRMIQILALIMNMFASMQKEEGKKIEGLKIAITRSGIGEIVSFANRYLLIRVSLKTPTMIREVRGKQIRLTHQT